MTIAEKIKISADKKCFTFFKEGLFYRCYNEDAMIFMQHIKAYKVSSRFVKSVGAYVYSIGFPVSQVEKGALSLEFISEKTGAKTYHKTNGNITFQLEDTQLKAAYGNWKQIIDNTRAIEVKEPVEVYETNYRKIIDRIKKYDLENSTPMQGLSFIQELKTDILQVKEINGNI